MRFTDRKMLPRIAETVSTCPELCPWNPFPPDSPWGRAIEDQYQIDRAALVSRMTLRQPFHSHRESQLTESTC